VDRGGSKGLAVATAGTFNAPQRRRFEEIGIKNKCLMVGWDHCYVTGKRLLHRSAPLGTCVPRIALTWPA
jgi:hypothetical protein